ncbi:MAG: O-antigen ligase family protein [Gemmatimonadota bacterium]
MESLVREGMVGTVGAPREPTSAERWALRVVQVGAVLVVLAAVTDRAFELDRFFIPKEAVLHLTALFAGLLAAGGFRRVELTRVDLCLAGYLLLSLASALVAQEGELAWRALAVSVSGVAVFWTARTLRSAGLGRPLMRLLALAIMVGAVTSLLQAYGITSDFFSINRAPGGTLGNRNSIAHMAAFGLPVVLLVALRAWRSAGYVLGAAGTMIIIVSLILTRSRAGWLAFAAVIAVMLAAMLLSRPLRRHGRTWGRLVGIVLLIGAGVAIAVLVPNSLRWRSDNPYLESVTGIANFQEGSGRGRLVQYRQSLRMAIDHPIFGIGPGNWPEVYPDYAAPNDPSMSPSRPGETANPWPSSDWVAVVAERGFPAAALFAAALLGTGVLALRRLIRARDPDEGLLAAGLLATVVATLVAGAFDAVLLLAHPTLLVWAAIGAMWPARVAPKDSPWPDSDSAPGPEPADAPRKRLQSVILVAVALAAGAGAARSIAQLSTMTIVGTLQPAQLLEEPIYAAHHVYGYEITLE